MISDTLHDAAEKIRADLNEFPDAFAGDREEILFVLWHMDQLRAKLDTAPGASVPTMGALPKIRPLDPRKAKK
jgi:hypothetical protein